MNTIYSKIFVICMIVAFGIGAATAAPSVTIDPTVTIGNEAEDTFQIDIIVDPDGNGISCGQIDLSFDASVLEVVSRVKGDMLGTDALDTESGYDNTTGTVDAVLIRIGMTTPPTPAGTWATITFRVKAGVTDYETDINITFAGLGNEDFEYMTGIIISNGTAISAIPDDLTITYDADYMVTNDSCGDPDSAEVTIQLLDDTDLPYMVPGMNISYMILCNGDCSVPIDPELFYGITDENGVLSFEIFGTSEPCTLNVCALVLDYPDIRDGAPIEVADAILDSLVLEPVEPIFVPFYPGDVQEVKVSGLNATRDMVMCLECVPEYSVENDMVASWGTPDGLTNNLAANATGNTTVDITCGDLMTGDIDVIVADPCDGVSCDGRMCVEGDCYNMTCVNGECIQYMMVEECEPECFGVDLYDMVCADGNCTQGALIEANVTECGYVPVVLPLDSIMISPAGSVWCDIGDSFGFHADCFNVYGEQICCPNLTWSSTNEYVATIDNDEEIHECATMWAAHSGITNITAYNGSIYSDPTLVSVYGEYVSDCGDNVTLVSDDVIFSANFSGFECAWLYAVGNPLTQYDECCNTSDMIIVKGADVSVGDCEDLENDTYTLTICYNITTLDILGIAPGTLTILKCNSTDYPNCTWEDVGGTDNGSCVTVELDHLCLFALAGVAKEDVVDDGNSHRSSGGGSGGGTYPPNWGMTSAPTNDTPVVTSGSGDGTPPHEPETEPESEDVEIPETTTTADDPVGGDGNDAATDDSLPESPGFAGVFAMLGILAVAYLGYRKKQ